LPVAATALLPLALFPLLGIAGIEAAAAPYADPIIFLFLGSLTLGLAIQRWGLHRRIAFGIIRRFGGGPRSLVLGFMLSAAFLSMWVSNTATAAMMLPVCLSTVALLVGPPQDLRARPPAEAQFALALLVGTAFAASIGGMATLVGTPPNALFAGFMRRTYGIDIGFARWLLVGAPTAVVFLIGTWLIVTRLAFKVPATGLQDAWPRVADEGRALGQLTRPQLLVAGVFLATALAWVARPLLAEFVPGLTDAGIAVCAALALFLIPSTRGGGLVDWATMAKLPWGVLVLFGGGLSLAAGIADSGLADWLGTVIGTMATPSKLAVVAIAVVLTIALSELASNTATAATFLPVVASVGAGLGFDAFALTVPVALAASCGLMLPVATPPNALFYSSGYIRSADLARAGLLADLLGAVLVLGAAFTLAGALRP
jgi:sodium-dependent dicarboxylate transporter 2/3/5